jgi:hypothetical protein
MRFHEIRLTGAAIVGRSCFFTWYRECLNIDMREQFYGLLKEYRMTIKEFDLCQEQIPTVPEGIEREQLTLKTEVARKRCAALRREIKLYPDIKTLPQSDGSNNSPRRYTAQAN